MRVLFQYSIALTPLLVWIEKMTHVQAGPPGYLDDLRRISDIHSFLKERPKQAKMHALKSVGALQFGTLGRLQCRQAPLGEVRASPHPKRDSHIRREGGSPSPGGFTVCPVKGGGGIRLWPQGKAPPFEGDTVTVPFLKSLQADRRWITPGSQVIGKLQDRHGVCKHGILKYTGFPGAFNSVVLSLSQAIGDGDVDRARDHGEGNGPLDGVHRGLIQDSKSGGLYHGDILDTPIDGNPKFHFRSPFHSPPACQRGVSLDAVDAL